MFPLYPSVLIARQSSPAAEAIPTIINIGQLVAPKVPPDYDRTVLEPLHKAQAELVAKIAREEAEAVRRAQEEREAADRAYWIDVDATASRLRQGGTYQNTYDFGNCTAYVAGRIQVPEYLGNATNWSWGLLNAGWRQGPPRRGAVGVSHNSWTGHVVVIERVDGEMVLVSEANYQGFNIVSERWTTSGEFEYFYP